MLAYNVTLLGSFVLCAFAAHALTWMLTRSHAAGAVSGLIFGFNPYRISHIAHLELLAVFWLPVAILALHRYVRGYQLRWLALFAAVLAVARPFERILPVLLGAVHRPVGDLVCPRRAVARRRRHRAGVRGSAASAAAGAAGLSVRSRTSCT